MFFHWADNYFSRFIEFSFWPIILARVPLQWQSFLFFKVIYFQHFFNIISFMMFSSHIDMIFSNIPLARMGSESITHKAEGRMDY